tara:strand:+ start:80 stop:1588 length:1509 start_codon:yes stop_codon:yes gene_type:complete
VIRQIVNTGGLVIYCVPTKALASQVEKDISEVLSSDEPLHRKDKPLYIVTAENKDFCSTVAKRLEELILDANNSNAIIICTLAGIEGIDESVISKAVNELGREITLIIDELPSLFSTYQHTFSGENVKVLEGLVTVVDGIASINNNQTYNNELGDRSFNSHLNKLLELIPSGNVRFEKNSSGSWTVFGYELKENLNLIMRHLDSVYILAATIKETLDYVILNRAWGFNLENCETVNAQVSENKIKEKEGNIRVYPLLDDSFSKGKALEGDYAAVQPKETSCLAKMIDNAKGFIQNDPALVVVNKWAFSFAGLRTKENSNIEVALPNVKGMNHFKEKHICCAIFSAKPNGYTTRSLILLAEKYSLDNLSGPYTLQTELDMIVQMCGRTSIRDRNSNETCHFLVSDKVQAEHVLKTYVSDERLYDSLIDESLIVNWSDFSDAKMGRPSSFEREELAHEMVVCMRYAEYLGEPIKQKELAERYGLSASEISKMLRDAGYKKKSAS